MVTSVQIQQAARERTISLLHNHYITIGQAVAHVGVLLPPLIDHHLRQISQQSGPLSLGEERGRGGGGGGCWEQSKELYGSLSLRLPAIAILTGLDFKVRALLEES